jgi:PD-(D/E)XK endonuclease
VRASHTGVRDQAWRATLICNSFVAISSGFPSDGEHMIPSMQLAWTPRRQGDAGELSAISWLFSAGADVYVPLFTGPDVDLIADFGDHVDRVQVKTSTCWQKNRFVVALCTRGGNQSWNGIVKRLDATRCDTVFVHVGDGRRWSALVHTCNCARRRNRNRAGRSEIRGVRSRTRRAPSGTSTARSRAAGVATEVDSRR